MDQEKQILVCVTAICISIILLVCVVTFSDYHLRLWKLREERRKAQRKAQIDALFKQTKK